MEVVQKPFTAFAAVLYRRIQILAYGSSVFVHNLFIYIVCPSTERPDRTAIGTRIVYLWRHPVSEHATKLVSYNPAMHTMFVERVSVTDASIIYLIIIVLYFSFVTEPELPAHQNKEFNVFQHYLKNYNKTSITQHYLFTPTYFIKAKSDLQFKCNNRSQQTLSARSLCRAYSVNNGGYSNGNTIG